MTMETQTPLQVLIARYRYHIDFAELDLTNINRQCYSDDDTLLHLVARVGTVEEIDLLVASGARINSIGDIGYTPLHYAAMKGRLDVTKKLLALGANPKIKSEFGETPLDVADNGKHAQIAKLLKHHK